MNQIKQAKESMQAISAALEKDYPDNSPVWAHVEDVAEVINGTAPDMLEALEASKCPCWVCNAAITNDIEALRKIALHYSNWNNTVRMAAIAKAKGNA